jgi:hypothetical protein
MRADWGQSIPVKGQCGRATRVSHRYIFLQVYLIINGLVLPKRAKLMIAGSIGAVGLVGLYVSDRLEEAIPAKAPPSKDIPQAGYQTV